MTTQQRHQVFTDQLWERIEPLLPSNTGRRARPFENNRRIVEGMIYRYRAGVAWRDLPREHFGPWQLATRYDKLAVTYRAAVGLSAVLTWPRQ